MRSTMEVMTVARIRPAHGGDAEIIHTLLLDCWQEAYAEHVPAGAFESLRRSGLAEWEAILREPEGVWIAHREGAPVGFARAIATGAGQVRPLELEKLYVRESEYGSGTAANLLEISIGDAPCQTWVANYNARARGFYTKAGFTLDEGPGAIREARTASGIYLQRMVR